MPEITEIQFLDLFSKLSESIKSIFDLTSRVDEKVKNIIENQREIEKKIDNMKDDHISLSARVIILEAKNNDDLKNEVKSLDNKVRLIETKLQEVGFRENSTTDKLKSITDLIMKGLLAVAIGYILWKMGIK